MKYAFTMIELIFVIVIIGILSIVTLPKFVHVANMGYENNLKAVAGTLNRISTGSIWGTLANKKNKSLASLDENNKMLTYYINVPYNLKTSSKTVQETNGIGLDKIDLKLTANKAIQATNVNNLPICKDSKGWIIMVGENDSKEIKPFEVKIGNNLYKMILCDNMLNNPLNFLVIKSTDNGITWITLK